MKCPRAETYILLRDSGELHLWRQRRLDRHLVQCSACRTYAAHLQAARAALHRQPQPALPAALRSAILAAARPDRRDEVAMRPAPLGSLVWRPALAFAALLACAGLGWYAFRPSERATLAHQPPPTTVAGNVEDAVDAEIEALQALLASSQSDETYTDELPDEETLARELLALQETSP